MSIAGAITLAVVCGIIGFVVGNLMSAGVYQRKLEAAEERAEKTQRQLNEARPDASRNETDPDRVKLSLAESEAAEAKRALADATEERRQAVARAQKAIDSIKERAEGEVAVVIYREQSEDLAAAVLASHYGENTP